MPIYRGAGGSGDATADSASEALLVRELSIEVEADAVAAAASATAAAGSASAAATSATNSSNSATASATSNTAAANSATAAAGSASTATTQAGTATTQATNASTSATAAAGSASTATTQATNASNSATAASTSATNASNSASAASASQAAALASQVAAEAAFDAFDDIYLGAKASNPTVDNDGGALTIGDQYFNTVANELRVWNGSSWQTASVVGGTVTNLSVTGNTTIVSGTINGTTVGASTASTGRFSTLEYTGTLTGGTGVVNLGSGQFVKDASGNVGIGTSSPASYGAGNTTLTVNGSTSGIVNLQYNGTNALRIASDVNGSYVYENRNLFMGFATNNTERMRIDASGNLLVGTTSALSSGSTIVNLGASRQVLTLKGDSNAAYVAGVWNASTTSDAPLIYFATETSLTVRGNITFNRAAGLTAYNTTSDYRLKDIISPVSDSGEVIDSVPVYIGKMKGATQARPMFIAHETPAYAHTGVKDAVDKDGNPVYQQMDASSLVPVLWAEIQSLRKRVAQLESK